MSITGTAQLSKGFHLYMPTDAQDTHIMKAHLRKHEVFHNIAHALENVTFNNSLGDWKLGSQHLVETSFQQLERTSMRKNGVSSAPIGDTDLRIQQKRFRQPKGRPHAKRSQSAFGNPGKTMREECPPSTSATPNPNGRRAEVENQIEQ